MTPTSRPTQRSWFLIAFGIAMLVRAPAVAQAPADSYPPLQEHRPRETVDDSGLQVVGGLLGGAAGALIGGFTGVALETALTSCTEWCGFGGAIIGVLVGESLGVPLGVEVASATRGNLAGPILLSFAASAGGLLLAPVSTGNSMLLVAPVQIYFSIKLR